MTDPSAISGVLGFAVLVALVAICGLTVEWLCEERDGDWQ
jgi:hypothetical protein